MSLHKQMNLQSEKPVVVYVLYFTLWLTCQYLFTCWANFEVKDHVWYWIKICSVLCFFAHVYWNGGCYLWWGWGCHLFWGCALVELMYLIYTAMPGDCYCRWFSINFTLSLNSLFLFSFYWPVSFICMFVVTQSTCSSTSHQTSMKSCSRHWTKVMCVALRTKILSLMARTWRPSSPCWTFCSPDLRRWAGLRGFCLFTGWSFAFRKCYGNFQVV